MTAKETDGLPRRRRYLDSIDRGETRSVSRIAGDIFTKASGEYQAMAIAQAVRIQLLARESGYSAEELLVELLSDEEELARVTTIANNAHLHAAATAEPGQKIPGPIDVKKTLLVIRPVFAMAIVVEEYSTEKLQYVLNEIYAEYLSDRPMKGKLLADKLFNRRAMYYLTLDLNTIHMLQVVETYSTTGPAPTGSTTASSE